MQNKRHIQLIIPSLILLINFISSWCLPFPFSHSCFPVHLLFSPVQSVLFAHMKRAKGLRLIVVSMC
uniref:Uncharacterized protein n=1 Tax=Rhizophora mucronata TaxID=61149 RepID=A0A2P2NKJ3_RHIMU